MRSIGKLHCYSNRLQCYLQRGRVYGTQPSTWIRSNCFPFSSLSIRHAWEYREIQGIIRTDTSTRHFESKLTSRFDNNWRRGFGQLAFARLAFFMPKHECGSFGSRLWSKKLYFSPIFQSCRAGSQKSEYFNQPSSVPTFHLGFQSLGFSCGPDVRDPAL